MISDFSDYLCTLGRTELGFSGLFECILDDKRTPDFQHHRLILQHLELTDNIVRCVLTMLCQKLYPECMSWYIQPL